MNSELAHKDFLNIQLFEGLTEMELEKLITKMVYRIRFYAEGETIMQRGDQVESLIALIDGELIGEMQVPGANDLRVEHILPGKLVASAFLFGDKNRLPVDLSARKPSRVLFISKKDLIEVLKSSDNVLENYLSILSGRGQFLADKLHFLTFRDLKQKVASYILNQCGEDYISFEMQTTQEELARLFGVARTSLIRAMNALQDDGLIEVDRKFIKILNKEALKKPYNMLKYDYSQLLGHISESEIKSEAKKLQKENRKLHDKSGAGSDFLGWVNLPSQMKRNIPENWKETAAKFSDKECIVCVGIGGSYLGAKAVAEALRTPFSKKSPELIFAGHHLGTQYHKQMLEYLQDKDFAVIVISKSGTTTEPAIAFRLLLNLLRSKVSEENLKHHIIAITDKKEGALRELADKLDLPSFVVPDDIGGRYSVLTPVGLIPLMIAGFDTEALICGAADMSELCDDRQLYDKNPALQYASVRQLLWKQSRSVEILSNTEPGMQYVAEWWKQLFGESEGKEGLGIFPASLNLTTDLHSLGQFMQEGHPIFFETFLQTVESDKSIIIPEDSANYDNLNYLSGKSLDYVNKQASEGTIQAHVEGDVPVTQIKLQRLDEYHLGQLFYFFEKACGISAYSFGINPFDQPGVEAYKRNMFKLLGKPGI